MKLSYNTIPKVVIIVLAIFQVLSYILSTSKYAFLSNEYIKSLFILLFIWYVIYIIGAVVFNGWYRIFFVAFGANYFFNAMFIFFFYTDIAYWFNH